MIFTAETRRSYYSLRRIGRGFSRIERMNADHSELIEAVQRLGTLWVEQGIKVAAPHKQETVERLLSKAGRRLTPDVVAFYSTVGGMPDGVMDDAPFSVWRLEEAIKRNLENPSDDWFFADHLIDSLLYAFSRQSDRTSQVVQRLQYEDPPSLVMGTTEEFFIRYANASTDMERLHAIL